LTEDLRATLRAELLAERPPPLGDVVGDAARAGRRIRRNRRVGTFGAGLAAAGIVAAAAIGFAGRGVTPAPRPGMPAAAALSPGSVPPVAATPTAAAATRTLTVLSGTQRAGGIQMKATSAAMLRLLATLLPAGRTSHYAVAADDHLHVQLYLDDGAGPGMVRVSVSRPPAATGRPPTRGATATVTVTHIPENCVQDTVVDAAWPDGTVVQVDVATCLAWDGVRNPPARRALTEAQAVRIAADPRWGVTMDRQLIVLGAQQFPGRLPVFA